MKRMIRRNAENETGKKGNNYILIEEGMLKKGILRSLTRSLVKIFAPML